jgi:hypothetical protein
MTPLEKSMRTRLRDLIRLARTYNHIALTLQHSPAIRAVWHNNAFNCISAAKEIRDGYLHR